MTEKLSKCWTTEQRKLYHRQTRQSLANRFHLLWVPSTTPASRTYVTNAITAHENHTKHRTSNVHVISALLIAVFYYQTSKLYWPAMGKFGSCTAFEHWNWLTRQYSSPGIYKSGALTSYRGATGSSGLYRSDQSWNVTQHKNHTGSYALLD